MLQKVIEILSSYRYPLNDEKSLQSAIEKKIVESGIVFNREYRLDSKNIPDFFIDGIAIEVKLKGVAKNIYKQCERYSKFDEVKQIILVTNRSMGFPKELNGKPCYVIKLGNAWL